MKVYLMMNDEVLTHNYMVLVGKEKDAEQLIKRGFFTYYEPIEVLDLASVENMNFNGVG